MVKDVTVKRGVKEIKWQKNPENWFGGSAPYLGMYDGKRRTVSKLEK